MQSCLPRFEQLEDVRGSREFKLCGVITQDILSQFELGYIPKLFEEDHLILLFKHLLIVAEVGEGKYLMACLLEEGAIPHPTVSLPAPQVAASLLFYFGPCRWSQAWSLLLSSFYRYDRFQMGASYGGWQPCPAVMKQSSLQSSREEPWFHHDNGFFYYLLPCRDHISFRH